MKPIAYIDADILLHRAVSFIDDEFGGEKVTAHKAALYQFDKMKEKWLKEVGPTEDYQLVISEGENFRKTLYPEYKANRKDIIPHGAFKGLKEEIKEYDGVVWEEGIEADDIIGIRCSENPEGTIAVSADKDFQTVPCKLMIPTSHGRKKPDWFTISEDEANLNWLRQAMMGDTIDNYKGIYRCGVKKAEAILPREEPLETLWAKTKAAFLEKGYTEDYALTMARLARILRHGDYNFKTKEVKLWTP